MVTMAALSSSPALSLKKCQCSITNINRTLTLSPLRAANQTVPATSATALKLRATNYALRATSAPSRGRRLLVSAMSASNVLTQDELKKLAADKAVEYVESGMVLGLGTGSTAAFVVAKIGELMKAGTLTNIVGVPTSKRTAEQAASLGIPLSVLDDHPKIDLAIDGADEVDPELNLVKGRGGALLREKMVEAASARFVVVVDESKLVSGLGGSGLAMPVEVVPFCWKYNAARLQSLFEAEGCEAKLRIEGDKPYVTDNSNYIVDLYFKTPIKDARAAGNAMLGFEGVVEHGLFLDMATAVIIAGSNGVTVKSK
uniref:ribose-5-phosphate isomerase n=1 Tax=Araucaria cunninghamii TaxID=56994 RepID=A0A0D6R5P8_ARACU